MKDIKTMTREQLELLVQRLDQENWTLRNKVKCLETDLRAARSKKNNTSWDNPYPKFTANEYGDILMMPTPDII